MGLCALTKNGVNNCAKNTIEIFGSHLIVAPNLTRQIQIDATFEIGATDWLHFSTGRKLINKAKIATRSLLEVLTPDRPAGSDLYRRKKWLKIDESHPKNIQKLNEM